MNTFGLIPARGGSKGIPRKNLAVVAGKPLISWTIAAALASGKLDRVIVSTDDPEIADVARQYGANVPFLRPAEFSRDDSTALDVALHALGWIAEQWNERPDYLMLLQPTSPLRTGVDIEAAIQLATSRSADAVLGVCEAAPHPYLARRIALDGTMSDLFPHENRGGRRQDFPQAYVINGAIYLNRCESLQRERTFQPAGALAYVMPGERSLDIDTPWELRLADFLLRESGN